MQRLVALLGQFSWILVGIALLFAVYLLPPDTSLSQVRQAGAITACVPTERPPIITGDPAKPGIEVEILTAIAQDIGVRLNLNTIPAMGQNFNPQSWGLTRAECAIIAGGLVESPQTRSFLEVSPSYSRTGWVAISKAPAPDMKDRKVGVLANVPGFDRIRLAAYLRDKGAMVMLTRSGEELASGLEDGTFEIGVAEALMGESLASGKGWSIRSLSPPLESYPLVFGLWKGDLTLKRALVGAFEDMRADGRLAAILKKYGVEAG